MVSCKRNPPENQLKLEVGSLRAHRFVLVGLHIKGDEIVAMSADAARRREHELFDISSGERSGTPLSGSRACQHMHFPHDRACSEWATGARQSGYGRRLGALAPRVRLDQSQRSNTVVGPLHSRCSDIGEPLDAAN